MSQPPPPPWEWEPPQPPREQPPQPPQWGAPPPGQQPPGPGQRRGSGRGVMITIVVVGALVAAVVVVTLVASIGSRPRATVTGTTTPAVQATEPTLPEQTEVTEPPETTEPDRQATAAKVGETLTLTDELDTKVLEVTVTRVRFSRGNEFDKPERGRFLLANVRVKALANEVAAPTLYVLVGTEKYDETIALLDAGPHYESYKSLSKGQTHQGLAVFDVPQGHGRIVLAGDSGTPLGYWTY